MTTTATTPNPKKSKKTLFFFVAFILALFGLDYYKTNFFFGTNVTVTDSTIVITPVVDTLKKSSTEVTVADTTKR